MGQLRLKTTTIFMSVILMSVFFIIAASPVAFSQQFTTETRTDNIVDSVIQLKAGELKQYRVYVPSEAEDPRIVGTYEAHGGLIERINLVIVSADDCPSLDLGDCRDVLLINEQKQFGSVDRRVFNDDTYFIVFYNDALFEDKQVEVEFDLRYNVRVPVSSTSTGGGGGGSSFPSGCLIATAAFGSELAPQVQFLREFRENHILSTSSGSAFMNAFNSIYYSFSPQVADYERGQPWLQQIVRTSIYPLLGILTASEKAYSVVPGEYGSLVAGLVASSLIGAVYVTPMVFPVKRIRTARLNYRLLISIIAVLCGLVVASLLLNNIFLLMATTSLLVVSTVVISAIISSSYLSRFIQRIVQKMKNY